MKSKNNKFIFVFNYCNLNILKYNVYQLFKMSTSKQLAPLPPKGTKRVIRELTVSRPKPMNTTAIPPIAQDSYMTKLNDWLLSEEFIRFDNNIKRAKEMDIERAIMFVNGKYELEEGEILPGLEEAFNRYKTKLFIV